MSETRCGHCGFSIHPSESGIRYFGTYVAHSEQRCRDLLRAEITSLRAQLDEARTKIARLVAILDHENPWDQKHVNELNESMIDIRALLSESKT